MSAQPALFLHARNPDAAPMELRIAIGRTEVSSDCCVVIAGSARDSAAYWDKKYPHCAPHRMATFRELVP